MISLGKSPPISLVQALPFIIGLIALGIYCVFFATPSAHRLKANFMSLAPADVSSISITWINKASTFEAAMSQTDIASFITLISLSKEWKPSHPKGGWGGCIAEVISSKGTFKVELYGDTDNGGLLYVADDAGGYVQLRNDKLLEFADRSLRQPLLQSGIKLD